MGCISSKSASSESPEYQRRSSSSASSRRRRSNGRRRSSSLLHSTMSYGPLEGIKEEPEKEEGLEEEEDEVHLQVRKDGSSKGASSSSSHKKAALFGFRFGRLTEGEQVAAGWPSWLSAAAGEAIQGWLPLRSDSFKRLEKIGQGTYSEVYRARNVESGRIVAVKKVRFDSFQADSVRFMAREIRILRRLDHPNVMKLEGIIASKLSTHVYLVFDYMEHDLAGLVSCPDIKFTDSQIKCYMKQLLSGLEHCHSRGILHRDIKTSNILVNNQGVLKIADFGLANFAKPKKQQPLTSRVVTLWYRPPELLLGATSYGEAVDLWSVGCVFAELFVGRPLLKGRTEVEQLHKIFKLCGTPPDEYWRSSKLPLAQMFRPQQSYESTLHERCRDFPKGAVGLIDTFLSFEPHKRGTASSALASKYFYTKPYACDPSSLPKYPPNKEMDAKYREDAKRRKAGATSRLPMKIRDLEGSSEESEGRRHGMSGRRRSGRTSLQYDTMSEASRMTQESQTSHISTTKSVPIQPSTTDFVWSKRGTSSRQIYPNRFESLDQSASSQDYEPQGFSADSSNTRKKSKVTFSGPIVYMSEQHENLGGSHFSKDV
ncbi:protein IMPAIRED IN BABA-INDUCED STERILITY 1-like [Salvia miltiorrhiza]|uniref:protein IMPAIRED IN BABA-INDUCED STERILITY 1-like n=1 Tax=Salvia miltiorrhiza TaxID=226208 RepID=UPI0025AD800C|nr:protein IMPAIRED IN BABA-INDUCED STERILITY 1-like [Salvia miltiorrhiza]